MRAKWFGCLLAVVMLGACGQEAVSPPEDLEQSKKTVVYGEDERQDVYAHPTEALKTLTRESIVALMRPANLDDSNPNDIRIDTSTTLGESQFLCRGERFFDQPAASFCSGTLIDDDLVLTAGHCVESDAECRSFRFVFNYFFEAEDQLATITQDDVYGCSDLVVQINRGNLDYAIVQLDRPVTGGHRPATVKLGDEPVIQDEQAICIGFPSGIPAKIDDGGRVTEPLAGSREFFRATTDTFGGNSGSGIFNADREVVGILVRGEQDYSFSNADGCFVVNELPFNGPQPFGEEITYASRAIEALCASGFESQRLCPSEGEGQWCDVCTDDTQCSPEWICQGHPANGAVRTCAAPCGDNSDCRGDHECIAGRCTPLGNLECQGGDVVLISGCGTELAPIQACNDSQVCRDGACDDVIEPPEGDLIIDPDSFAVAPQNPVEGELALLTVTVRNNGRSNLSGPTIVELFDERNGDRVRIAQTVMIRDTLAPGEARVVQFEIQLPVAGDYTVVAVGDPGQSDDPSNNEARTVVTVLDDDTVGPTINNLTIVEDGGDGDGFIEEGESILVSWNVSDPSGIRSVRVFVDGLGRIVTTDDSGVLEPLTVGSHEIRVEATDDDNTPQDGPPELRTIEVFPLRPEVVRLEPFDGAQGVVLSTQVAATFDIALDPNTVNDGALIVTDGGGQEVPGTVFYDADERRVRFAPLGPLQPETIYTAVLSGVSDFKGDGLQAPVSWSFTTQGEAGPSIANIGIPDDGAGIGGVVDVFGTATSPDFLAYALVFAPLDDPNQQTPIGTPQPIPVVDGLLGTWDTSDLNGSFILALVVVEQNMNLVVDQITVVIDNSAPQIADIRAVPGNLTQTTEGPLTVSARIDEVGAGIDQVTLRYQIDGGLTQTVRMRAAGDRFQGTIDEDWSALGGSLLTYTISAVDSAGLSSRSDEIQDRIDIVDTPPRIDPLPIVTLEENSTSARAIDLFEFARDDQTPAERLSYAISAVGAVEVEVRLEEGRFVTVEARGTFTGTTTATVTVGDGGAFASGSFRIVVEPDSLTPRPDPPGFERAPSVGAPDTAVMTAELVRDRSGVEYFFEETTGNPGGEDSGWQASREFSDADLLPGFTYTYRVRARDLSSARNETAFGEPISVTMPGQCDICPVGERRCGLGNIIEICEADVRGCTDWTDNQACGPRFVCDAGQCIPSCDDECPEPGLVECADATSNRVCGDFDGDVCLEWSEPTDCGDGFVCGADASCEPACEPDIFEPNDDASLTVWMPVGDHEGLWVCDQDEDWFAVDLRTGETLGGFVAPLNGDVLIQVFEGDGETLVTELEGRRGQAAMFDVTAEEDGTWIWRISSLRGVAVEYDASIGLRQPPGQICELDTFQCAGRTAIEVCVLGEGGTPGWSAPELCPETQVCAGQGLCRDALVDPNDIETPEIEDRFSGEQGRPRFDGCGCEVAGAPAAPSWPLWALALFSVVVWRRAGR